MLIIVLLLFIAATGMTIAAYSLTIALLGLLVACAVGTVCYALLYALVWLVFAFEPYEGCGRRAIVRAWQRLRRKHQR